MCITCMVDVLATIASCRIMLSWDDKQDDMRSMDESRQAWDRKDGGAVLCEEFDSLVPSARYIRRRSMARLAGSRHTSAVAPFHLT